MQLSLKACLGEENLAQDPLGAVVKLEPTPELFGKLAELPQIDRTVSVLPESPVPLPRPGSDQQCELKPLFETRVLTDSNPAQLEVPKTSLPVLSAGVISSTYPQGNCTVAPEEIRIAFSRPVGKLGETSVAGLELDPPVPGDWYWREPRMLVFAPGRPLTPATPYRVTCRLVEPALEWTFSTPGPVGTFYPSHSKVESRLPSLCVSFDQPVDGARMILTGAGREWPVESIHSGSDTYLAFRPLDKLPMDTAFEFRLEDVESRLGPIRGKCGPFPFRTHLPLELIKTEVLLDLPPVREAGRVQRFGAVIFHFNYSLKIEASVVRFEPPLECQVSAAVLHERLQVRFPVPPDCQPGSLFSLAELSLEDKYGQGLEQLPALSFAMDLPPHVVTSHGRMVVVPNRPGPKLLPFYALNAPLIRVEARAVQPEAWLSFLSETSHYKSPHFSPFRPGELLGIQEIVSPPEGGYRQSAVDLAPWVPVHGIEMVLNFLVGEHCLAVCWVQVTRLGLSAFLTPHRMRLLVTDLLTGLPLQGARAGSGESDHEGMLEVAVRGEPEVWFGAEHARFLLSHLERCRAGPELVWFACTDRLLYRPGETFCCFGWVRGRTSVGAELEPACVAKLSYELQDGRQQTFDKGELELTAGGGFSLRCELPVGLQLGQCRCVFETKLAAPDDRSTVTFRVEEIRRPEFEVRVHLPGETSWRGPDPARVTAEASYYAGGKLVDSPVAWEAELYPARFEPPGHPGFHFGRWQPPWWCWRFRDYPLDRQECQGRTDRQGRHSLEVIEGEGDGDRRLVMTAHVTDRNRQRWSGRASWLRHPSALTIGLRPRALVVLSGAPVWFDMRVCDLEGRALSGIEVEYGFGDGDWQRCQSQAGPMRLQLELREGGPRWVTVRAQDADGRLAVSAFPVFGRGRRLHPVPEQNLQLVLDQEHYQPGDTGELTVLSPLPRGSGLLRIGNRGLLFEQRFTLEHGVAQLTFPVTTGFFPEATISVDIVGLDGERPAVARGDLVCAVEPRERRLEVQIELARRELEPGETQTFTVAVHDAAGRPAAGAEVVLMAVDAAILGLADYRIPSALASFYAASSGGMGQAHLHNFVLEADLNSMLEELARQGPQVRYSMRGSDGRAPDPGGLRSDFNPLLVFAPQLLTDASGKVEIDCQIPGNLTRYLVTAVASWETGLFGQAEDSFVVSRPLMVRTSPPRMLRLGDQFELAVVVQNLRSHPLEVELGVRSNGVRFLEGEALRFSVPAESRREVGFRGLAEQTGPVAVQTVGRSGSEMDASQITIPVTLPGSLTHQAVYATLEDKVENFACAIPSEVLPELGGLDLQVADSVLFGLDDAVEALLQYPYECAEIVASRLMVASIFSPKASEQILTELLGFYGSGFGCWPGQNQHSFLTCYATHALILASRHGLSVPARLLEESAFHLQALFVHDDGSGRDLHTVRAYACWILSQPELTPQMDVMPLALQLAAQPGSLEALAWLQRFFRSRNQLQDGVSPNFLQLTLPHLRETAASAHFVDPTPGSTLHTFWGPRRVDGLMLSAVLESQPNHPLAAKLARGLLDHRVDGHWQNSQENVFALLALSEYFRLHESSPSDALSRTWLDDRLVWESRFGGDCQRRQVHLPMPVLQARLPHQLTVLREGAGRLYFRAGLSFFPADWRQAALNRGFTVGRSYRGAGVSQDAEGVWHAPAGSEVEVQLVLSCSGPRSHVALVDPLPSGLETSGPPPRMGDHQNFRDDRVEIFWTRLEAGSKHLTYRARATARGLFRVPPARAEEMYAPETFGQGCTHLMQIE